MMRTLLFLMAICTVSVLSCNKKGKLPPGFEEGDEYYSVTDYLDQFYQNTKDQPYVLIKVVSANGSRPDTTFQSWDSVFPVIRKYFEEADISEQQFLGKYDFSYMQDEKNNMVTLLYEANKEDLFTRKYVINFDMDYSISSFYIETKVDKFNITQLQKLTFVPLRSIQIMETKKPLIGKDEDIITNYKFR